VERPLDPPRTLDRPLLVSNVRRQFPIISPDPSPPSFLLGRRCHLFRGFFCSCYYLRRLVEC
jgi:hypothetical protein